MKCPKGSFIVPTRLQASSNSSQFCGSALSKPHELYDGSSLSIQRKNPYDDPKQARRFSYEFYANGKLNRHDNPYFPIYNTSHLLWDCVGDPEAVEQGCSFLVRSSDFTGMEVNHGSELMNNQSQLLITLVMTGPFCSTADMFDQYERFGGIVYRMYRNTSSPDESFTKIGRYDYQPETSTTPVTKTNDFFADVSLEMEYKLKADETSIALMRNPLLHQSEDVYLVIGHEKGTRPLNHCILELIPREPDHAKKLYYENE